MENLCVHILKKGENKGQNVIKTHTFLCFILVFVKLTQKLIISQSHQKRLIFSSKIQKIY